MQPLLPDDWREQVTAMVSGQAPLDGALFRGGPVLGPADQIGVYANQYRIRLYDALAEEVVGLRVLLGDRLKSVLWAYLRDQPSTSWTLERIAVRLEGWLRDQGAPVEQIEMAALDRAVQVAFIAADPRPLSVEQLQSLPDLELAPSVQRLWLTTNVHDVRSAVRSRASVQLEHGVVHPLVVFRKGLGVQTVVLPAGAWHLLHGFERGLSIPDALEELVVRERVTADEVGASIQGWFRDLATHGLVQVRTQSA